MFLYLKRYLYLKKKKNRQSWKSRRDGCKGMVLWPLLATTTQLLREKTGTSRIFRSRGGRYPFSDSLESPFLILFWATLACFGKREIERTCASTLWKDTPLHPSWPVVDRNPLFAATFFLACILFPTKGSCGAISFFVGRKQKCEYSCLSRWLFFVSSVQQTYITLHSKRENNCHFFYDKRHFFSLIFCVQRSREIEPQTANRVNRQKSSVGRERSSSSSRKKMRSSVHEQEIQTTTRDKPQKPRHHRRLQRWMIILKNLSNWPFFF